MSQDVRRSNTSSFRQGIGSRRVGGGRPRFINSSRQQNRLPPGGPIRGRGPHNEPDPELPSKPRRGPVPSPPKRELKGFWGNKERKPLSMAPQGTTKQPRKKREEKKQENKQMEEIEPMHNEKVTTVLVEGQVILQIMKHARSNETKMRTGVLQGLKKPASSTVEVTYAIATPDDTKSRAEDHQFARRMLDCLESTNIDRMEVGWYRTCVNTNFYDEDTIIRCTQWQESFSDSIMLVYDSRGTQHGRLSLRAYQLTDKFFTVYTSRNVGHTAMAEAEVGYGDLFREIPVKIHNSYLVHAFLYELQNEPSISCDYDRLTHWRNSQLSHNLTAMEHSIEDYYNLQNDYRKWQMKVQGVRKERDRQRAKCQSGAQMEMLERNLPLPDEPPRVRSILSCAQLNEIAGSMFGSITQMHAKTLMQRAVSSDS